jgi:hypothetical protein
MRSTALTPCPAASYRHAKTQRKCSCRATNGPSHLVPLSSGSASLQRSLRVQANSAHINQPAVHFDTVQCNTVVIDVGCAVQGVLSIDIGVAATSCLTHCQCDDGVCFVASIGIAATDCLTHCQCDDGVYLVHISCPCTILCRSLQLYGHSYMHTHSHTI